MPSGQLCACGRVVGILPCAIPSPPTPGVATHTHTSLFHALQRRQPAQLTNAERRLLLAAPVSVWLTACSTGSCPIILDPCFRAGGQGFGPLRTRYHSCSAFGLMSLPCLSELVASCALTTHIHPRHDLQLWQPARLANTGQGLVMHAPVSGYIRAGSMKLCFSRQPGTEECIMTPLR